MDQQYSRLLALKQMGVVEVLPRRFTSRIELRRNSEEIRNRRGRGGHWERHFRDAGAMWNWKARHHRL